jgi:hypothetical protein
MPLRSCVVCRRAEAPPNIQLQYCAACQSAVYCSEACQRKDWRKQQHKKVCKLLNVGHGDMQVRSAFHISLSIAVKEQFERQELSLDEDGKRFYKLFEESTSEGSQAAARKMKKIAKRQTKRRQKFLLFHSLYLLGRSSDSKMLLWPNSPLLVMLHFVDPNVLSGDEHEPLEEGDKRFTPLHMMVELADPSDYSTHKNQLILAKQLIEHGANVNTVDHMGVTPLMGTVPGAPGAAKFLLNWPTTDANITSSTGASFLAIVRMFIAAYSEQIARPDTPDKVQVQFLLQQWREIEEMLVTRGAFDTGITELW